MTRDVFEEDPLGAAFFDDPGDVRPEMPGIFGATALARCAERLAGIPGEDDVEGPTKWPGIEGSQVVPDWRVCKVSCALGGDEDSAGIALPFDEGAGVIAGLREHEAQIPSSAACAEGQSVPGT